MEILKRSKKINNSLEKGLTQLNFDALYISKKTKLRPFLAIVDTNYFIYKKLSDNVG